MSWLERLRQRPSSHSTAEEHVGATQAPVEWISPGLSALFEALSGDRGYSILDLADHAGNSHLEVLGQFSRQIRFAGLTPSPPHGDAFASALLELPPGPCAYDVVLAWDVMDRLGPHERERLMDCLVEVTAPRGVAARCRGLVGRRVGPASSSHASSISTVCRNRPWVPPSRWRHSCCPGTSSASSDRSRSSMRTR